MPKIISVGLEKDDLMFMIYTKPERFHRPFHEFLVRGDSNLILELDDGSKISIGPEYRAWQVAISETSKT